uniref:Protocadherin-like wing polarity protein stan n=1 Tax=Anoplophora glabripennis TaxID=217634 RepID=V5I8B0_ANOGL
MAKYTDASLTIEKDIAFSNRDDPALITIKLDSYTEYFGISYTEDKWVFKVLKALPTKILTSNKEIAITLTASEENNDATGHSVLVINWDTKDAPLFSEEYYSGSYPESGKGNITLTTDIGFTNVENPKNVEVQLNSYDEYFAVKYDSGKWDLSILKSLDDATLSKNSQLIIVLTAIETDNTKNGHSVLVLQLPSNAIQFAEAYYVAEYPKSGSGTIEFENPIELVNAKDPTKVTITLDNYKDNFEIKYDANKWTINIISALDDATLKANTELVITLTASEAGKENTGHAVLVLKLPVEVVPEFSAAYYTANYPADGSGTIEFEPSLEISNIDNPEDIAITLDNYEANFDITYDNNKWVINIKNSLDHAILKANSELVMTLAATEVGNESIGQAVLILNLPAELAPKFSEVYYTADYPEDGTGTIDFKPSLGFSNVDDPKDVVIALDQYTENFELIYDSNKWYIKITKSLDDETLLNNQELVLTLTASASGISDTGETILVMNLPRNKGEEAPEFSKAYYIAQYPQKGSGVIAFEDPIEFTNVNEMSTVTITLDSKYYIMQ